MAEPEIHTTKKNHPIEVQQKQVEKGIETNSETDTNLGNKWKPPRNEVTRRTRDSSLSYADIVKGGFHLGGKINNENLEEIKIKSQSWNLGINQKV